MITTVCPLANGVITVITEGKPVTYEEAVTSEKSELWKKAMMEELEALDRNKTWTLVKLPEGVTLGNKWVYKIKRKANRDAERYKAQLVAGSFQQKYGRDYHETSSPTFRFESMQTIFSVAAAGDLQMW